MIGNVLAVGLLAAATAVPSGSTECFGIDAGKRSNVPSLSLKGLSSRQKNLALMCRNTMQSGSH